MRTFALFGAKNIGYFVRTDKGGAIFAILCGRPLTEFKSYEKIHYNISHQRWKETGQVELPLDRPKRKCQNFHFRSFSESKILTFHCFFFNFRRTCYDNDVYLHVVLKLLRNVVVVAWIGQRCCMFVITKGNEAVVQRGPLQCHICMWLVR